MKKTSGFAVASLVLGILAPVILFSRFLGVNLWRFMGFGFPWFLILVFLVLAITFGAIAIRQTRKDSIYKGKGIAIAALCIPIIEIVLILWGFLEFARNL